MKKIILLIFCFFFFPCISYAALFEPEKGCYLGAYILEDQRAKNDPVKFAELTGKKHAAYFTYVAYGQPFPKSWAEKTKQGGSALHIAFEPNSGLEAVKDGFYLQSFMRAAAETNVPIFLRFASEMNGNWTAYSGNPKKYKEAWKIIYQVARREAPNVAMVWVPFESPQSNMLNFYPGNEYVDWIGMNIYCVYVHNGDPKALSYKEDPIEFLSYLYKRIPNKPFFIGEFGVSHHCRVTGDQVKFAAEKYSRMYKDMKKYPRVKAIFVFDSDAINKHEKHNDYSLTGKILDHYKNLIQDPYFLSNVQGYRYVNGILVPEQKRNKKTYVHTKAMAKALNENISWDSKKIIVGNKNFRIPDEAFSEAGIGWVIWK
ncbi:MAG: hypothetical protein STSR0004_21880 [Peptococcaceae bacterium]